jgi:hypothetical protein
VPARAIDNKLKVPASLTSTRSEKYGHSIQPLHLWWARSWLCCLFLRLHRYDPIS